MSPGQSPKRVEFAPTHLDTIDSEAPAEHNSGMWDTETDHILSYFLSGGDAMGQNHGYHHADFASTAPPSSSTSASLTGDDLARDATWQMPPPTPAVQFYSHSSSGGGHHHNSRDRRGSSGSQGNATTAGMQQSPVHQPLTSTSQSSSSSSLSSMAAALVSGMGPGMLYSSQLQLQRVAAGHHQQMFPAGSGDTGDIDQEGESPISPAAMIGSGHENLLLPPPMSGLDTVRRSAPLNNSGAMLPPNPRSPKPTWYSSAASTRIDVSSNLSSSAAMPPPPPHVMMAPLLPQAGSVASSGFSLQPTTEQQQQLLYAAAAAHAASLQHGGRGNAPPPVESEEKRAKRLERNRESARKSRRRKKERLVSLEKQVNKLHNDIEIIRRNIINAMVPALLEYRKVDIPALTDKAAATNRTMEDALQKIIQETGPSSSMMRSVLDFQYTMLKRLTLPGHQKFMIWLTLREEKFFAAGKEEYGAKVLEQKQAQQKQLRTVADNNTASKPTVKISSKQVGEEITNGTHGTVAAKKRGVIDDDNGKPYVTSTAHDAVRMWPLFCFELKFSVDQEDRFVAAHKQITGGHPGGSPNMAQHRAQLATAVNTVESLSKAVGTLSHLISKRDEKMYLWTLVPQQVSFFHSWMVTGENRDRCQRAIRCRHDSALVETASAGSKETSLQDICRRLNEVLQISTTVDDMNYSE